MNDIENILNQYLTNETYYYCKISETEENVINIYSQDTKQNVFDICITKYSDDLITYYVRTFSKGMIKISILSDIQTILQDIGYKDIEEASRQNREPVYVFEKGEWKEYK